MEADPTRQEDIRCAVRAYLAARPNVAQSAATITRRIRTEVAAPHHDVEAALEFWASLEPAQASFEYAPAGATKYWKITAAGTLAHERGQ